MDVAIGVIGHDLVHEVEELDTAPPTVVAGPDLAGSHVERGKEGGRAVPGIVMAVSGEGAAVLELEIALRPFQGLDVRLLVDREHESALGRIKIEADDLRGLGDEIGIVALAPGLPPVEVDLLGPQEAPDILVADVAQSLGHEPARPAGIALRRRPPQHRQNAAVRRLVILGRGAAARTRAIIETRQPLFGEADAPMAHRTRHRA